MKEAIPVTDFAASLSQICQQLVQTVTGKYAIALAGAHAKGTADAASDLDLFLFAERERPFEERLERIRSLADPETEPYVCRTFDDAPWGGSMDFLYRGTPVEVTCRRLDRVEKIVEDCLAGKFQIVPAIWTANGYDTFLYLSELHFLKPVADPHGALAALQAKAAEYPEPLRRSILKTFMGRAGTWLDNFHYDNAIRRGDILFTTPIVLHTVLDLAQVVFAFNRVYFPGDKKLEAALSQLPYCPEGLRSGLDTLLTGTHDPEILESQRRILRTVYEELKDRICTPADS